MLMAFLTPKWQPQNLRCERVHVCAMMNTSFQKANPSPYDAPTSFSTNISNSNNNSTAQHTNNNNPPYDTTLHTSNVTENQEEHMLFLRDKGYAVTKRLGNGCKYTHPAHMSLTPLTTNTQGTTTHRRTNTHIHFACHTSRSPAYTFQAHARHTHTTQILG